MCAVLTMVSAGCIDLSIGAMVCTGRLAQWGYSLFCVLVRDMSSEVSYYTWGYT